MALTKEQMIDEIKGMSVVDLNELVKALEEEFGVSAAAATVVAGAPAAGAAAAGGDAGGGEQTEFKVTLTEVGDSKIEVIKTVREIKKNAIGLKEAKALVDTAPEAVILENVPQAEADEAKTKLEGVGAKVTVA